MTTPTDKQLAYLLERIVDRLKQDSIEEGISIQEVLAAACHTSANKHQTINIGKISRGDSF